MQKTPGKSPADRKKYWTEIIEEARKYPNGITQYCRDKRVSKDNYYQWFKRLKEEHPDWEPLNKSGKEIAKAKKAREPETQVTELPRRRFSEAFKARILELTDKASVGEISSILRREALYSSHLQKWRAERAAGSLQAKKRGTKANPLTAENKQLRLENERLQKRIRQQELLIELQKKVSEILNVKLPKLDEID
jgi:transposase